MPQDLFPNAIRYVGALLLSLGAAWLLTPRAARLAYRYDILDRPGGYKRQSQATPYLGGLAVAVGFLVIGLAVGGANGALLTILGGAVILGVVGLVDDVRQVSPFVRLGFEAIAGVALWVAGIRAGFLGVTWFDLPLTVLWVVAVVNAFNMVDNHDGVASGVAAAAAVGVAAIAGLQGDYLVTSFSLAVAGACIGFLWHNKPPARIYLGDAGSMFLGFLVAALTLKVDLPVDRALTRAVVALLLAAVPLFDETLVIVARLLHHRPVMLGGTDHSAHRLSEHGWSKPATFSTLVVAQFLCSELALIVANAEGQGISLGFTIGVATVWIGLLTLLLRMPTPVVAEDASGTPRLSAMRFSAASWRK